MHQRWMIFGWALLASAAQAGPCTVGHVEALSGHVELQRQAQISSPTPGMVLCQGDRFVTAPDSIAQLRLRDGTKITVGKDSDFRINQYRIYQRKPNVALFELAKGAFRSITGLMTKRPHRFEVHTATATLGVRGTDFWGGYGLTENGLDVLMLEGHGVYVKNALGQIELDQPGLGTTVLNRAAPAAAKTWGEAKREKAFATITP